VTENTWGAFVNRYKPNNLVSSSLEKYLVSMGVKRDSAESTVIKGREVYYESLKRHFARLTEFLNSEEESLVNLVFGNVQSGKTGHLLANICWAKDNKIHLAIVFTGANTDLGQQTVERLKTKLPANTASVIPSPTESRLATGPVLDQLQEAVYNRISSPDDKPIPVVTLIKSSARLSAVRIMIEELNTRINLPLNVVILDDEADQASVDSTASTRSQVDFDVSLAEDQTTRTTIHNRINEIRDRINGKHIYLAYTATPQALMHGDLYGPLQPEYCSVVPAGEGYTSIGDIVRNRKILIKLDHNDRSVSSNENLSTMEFCFIQFLVLSWLHNRHSDIFHGKDLNHGKQCEENSIQFLIHPSGRNTDHEDYKDTMDSCLRDFRKYMESEADQEQFIDIFFKPAYMKVAERFSPMTKEYLEHDEQKIDCWDYVLRLLNDTNRLRIKLVNYKQRKEISNQGISEPLVPIKPEQWNSAEAWVLIGGDILGRGLSIPHLVITLFLRNPNNPIFDTAIQQMRFCGYRNSYLDTLQIYADEDIINGYMDAVVIDEPFRQRTLRWDTENRNLKTNPPVLRFIAPSTTRFSPTRNNVLSGEIALRDTTSSSGFFSLSKIANPKYFINNLNVIIDLTHDLPEFDHYEVDSEKSKIKATVYSITYEDAKVLLKKWSLADDERVEFSALVELMGYPTSEKGLADLEFLLSVDTVISKYHSAEEFINKYDEVENLSERTLSSVCNATDWLEHANLSLFDRSEAKAIVGGSERNMQKQYSDKVLIQCRMYELLNPNTQTAGPGSRNSKGRGVGRGLSLIGWIPDSKSEFYVNREAGRLYDI
jgi:hypothetical protein